MKHLRNLIVLLIVCCASQTLRAQTTDSWVTIPLGEQLLIQMPKSHAVNPMKRSFENFSLEGSVYTAKEDGVDYTVWSFVNEGQDSNRPMENQAYLDACADLVWESLLKPLRDQVPKSPEFLSQMSYQGELIKLVPGREYGITLGNKPGTARFYVTGRQIYVLTVLNAEETNVGIKRFFSSFGLKAAEKTEAVTLAEEPTLIPTSEIAPAGTGVGPGRGENPGGNSSSVGGDAVTTKADGSHQVFKGIEVNQKVRILSKPEPQYTESARKYSVQGTVVLRAVFSRTGKVTNITARLRLPHGLTERAISAAKQMRFTPALKDGNTVSMYIQLEYNFNLY